MLFSLTCVKRNKEFGACMQMCRNVIKAVLKKTAKKQQWHEQQPKKSLQTIKGDSNWYLCNVITSRCLCDTLCQFCRVFESRLYTLVLLDLVIKWTFLYKSEKSFCNFMCVRERETDRMPSMPGDSPAFSCIVAFLISSWVDGSSSSSFTSTWGLLASEDSCAVCWSLKMPSKCSYQCWRMASLFVSRVLP